MRIGSIVFSTFASCEFKDRCEILILECFDFVSCACVSGRKKKKASQSPEAPPKAERPLTECPDPGQWSWDEMPTNGTRVQFLGDSKVVCSWANSLFALRSELHRNSIHSIWHCLLDFWSNDIVCRTKEATYFEHIFRERNRLADSMATSGIESFGKVNYGNWRGHYGRPARLRGWFDGGCVKGVVGAGIVLEGCRRLGKGESDWIRICAVGTRICSNSGSSDIAELFAAAHLLAAVAELLSSAGHIEFSPHCRVVAKSSTGKHIMATIERLWKAVNFTS